MDYSIIDWSKLPELPELDGCRLSLEPSSGGLRILAIPRARYDAGVVLLAERRSQEGRWYYRVDGERELVDLATSATDIIDRFIAEQEAELSKPKPRRVTPKDLLVELIQTGAEVSVDYDGKRTGTLTHLRWVSDNEYGLQGKWSCWDTVGIKWLMRLEYVDILDVTKEPPKPRLPVKTKAPEGCRWVDDNGSVRLVSDTMTVSVPRSKELAVMHIATGNAYLELNPAT